jgi:ABC-type transport system involved in multi-copper enzyme maturation permease subunit
MKKLLEIEYLKIKNFTVFKAFMLLFIVVVPLLFYSIGGLSSPFQAGKDSFFGFPNSWAYLLYISSWCMLFPALLVLILVANEISYKTQRQHVIDGLSRKDTILSKFYLITVLTVLIVVYVFIVGAIFGLFYGSFKQIFDNAHLLVYFTVQTFGYLSLALFVAVLVKRTSIGVLVYIVAFLLLGILLQAMLETAIAQWLPLNVYNGLIEWPFFDFNTGNNGYEMKDWMRLILAIFYAASSVYFSFIILKKRDL